MKVRATVLHCDIVMDNLNCYVIACMIALHALNWLMTTLKIHTGERAMPLHYIPQTRLIGSSSTPQPLSVITLYIPIRVHIRGCMLCTYVCMYTVPLLVHIILLFSTELPYRQSADLRTAKHSNLGNITSADTSRRVRRHFTKSPRTTHKEFADTS